ncbi:hypothetical protein ABXT08_12160 [Chryseobacterium sp. NRRL B-14859]|uniref:hypothetical protein n=1 Tax=Chryseobacterium sp. NRRL B-14859 TaxID=1562763 RepID=UPI0033925245
MIIKNMKEAFPEMKSEKYGSGLIPVLQWGIIIILTGIGIALLVAFISTIVTGPVSSIIIFFFLFIIAGSLTGFLIYEAVKLKDQRVYNILVNDRGVSFLNKSDAIIYEIKYKDLAANPDDYKRDLFSASSGTGKFSSFRMNLFIFIKGKDQKIRKRLVNFSTIPLKNKYALIGYFLKGVRLYRPDLNIDPKVYRDFYLDEKSLCFDPEIRRKDFLLKGLGMTVALLILLFVFYYTENRNA